MSHYTYERLSAQDNDFLQWERPNLPMHGGATQVFEAGDLATDDGGIDFGRVRRGIESILHKIPRYRQKLAWIPHSERAIWIDDPQFNLDYHLRHTSLPRPGTNAQLKRLAARIAERPLDHQRPLWEIWVVEGLEGGRFATIAKTHHCMIDGAGGMALAQNLFATDADWSIQQPHRYTPRPAPSEAELRADERWRLLGLPVRVVSGLQDFVRRTPDIPTEVIERAKALGEMAKLKVVPASETPLNGWVGPHRDLDWFSVRLADVKAVRKALGCSINDVVLAVMTGAVREYMLSRSVRPDDLEFRVATPVNVRPKERQVEAAGNFVSTWIVPLPIDESDPLERVERIHRKTSELKNTHQSSAIEMVEALHEWIPVDLQSLSKGTQNLYVTNVPGPQFPLYLLGARLERIFIQAPLLENLGVAVGVLSYDGRVCFSITVDPDHVPDVGHFVNLIWRAFLELADASGVELEEREKGE